MPKQSSELIIDRPYDTSARRGGGGGTSTTSGATTLLGLNDTPSSYAGQAGKVLAVNSGEDGAEFIAIPVTSVNGQTGVVVLDQDDVGDGTTYKQYSATEKTKLAGIEALADVTDAGNIASSITGVSTDDTIADADVWGYLTGGALVKTAWSNIKAVLKTYFDTLYNLYTHPNHTGDVTSVADGATTIGASKVLTAMIADDNVTAAKLANMAQNTIKGRITASTGDPEDLTPANVRTIINVASGADVTGAAITALATKTTPVDADAVVITDSAAGDAPKRTTWANIKATLKTYFDTLYVALTGAQTITGVKTFSDQIIGNGGIVGVTNNRLDRNTTATTLMRSVATMRATSTGSAADGFGPGFFFVLNDAETGDDTTNTIGQIGAVRSGADNSGDIVILAISAGVAVEVARFAKEGRLAVGVTAAQGKLHVEQASTTAAIPTLRLKQSDLSEEFIRFETTVGAGNAIDTAALGAYYGKVRVYVEGVGAKWIALYS